jgi:hypothetical protein
MGNDKRMGMSTRNDKINTITITWASKKRHSKHQNHNVRHKHFSFQAIGGIKISRVEGIGHNVGGYQEIHKGHYMH